jgi:hypothetical protein
MRRERHWTSLVAPAVLAGVLAAAAPGALAQKAPDRVDDPRPPANTNRPRPVVTSPTTGALSVVAGIRGAKVQLFSIARDGRSALKSTVLADDDGNATFSSLAPGSYRVIVSNPDHDDATEEVRIVAGKAETVSGKPRPRFGYVVIVRPELAEDTVIEIDGTRIAPSAINRDANGTAWIKQPLGKHVVRILKPGFEPYVVESDVVAGDLAMVAPAMEREWSSLVVRGQVGTRVYLDGAPAGIVPSTGAFEIPRLVAGRSYELRFELDDFQPLARVVLVERGTKPVVDAALEPLPTNGPFEDAFLAGLAAWDAPATWRAEGGVLTVAGPGVGFARDSRYRDFDMRFAVRLVGQKGAAWVLRGKDEKNYYLFVLGGPAGRYPNQLRTYVVRDGVFDPAAPASTLPVVEPLAPDDTYLVRIRAEQNVIQQWLTPSSTGEEMSIGLFTDVKRMFAFGRIGFAAPFDESFMVNGLSVVPAGAR